MWGTQHEERVGGFSSLLFHFDVGETAYRRDNVNKAFYGADTQHAKGQKTNVTAAVHTANDLK